MSAQAQAVTGMASELKQKIETRKAQVGVIGLGYVGLHLALLFSEERSAITGFDIDQQKVKTLEQGGSYIYRITPGEIQLARQQGFKATFDFSQLEHMDAVIICVPTPLDEYREP